MIQQIKRDKFFSIIKPLFVKFSQGQVDGINFLLDSFFIGNNVHLFDFRQLAYIMATVFHETAATMQPIGEFGKGKLRKYGTPSKNGEVYYGRGYVQLTWEENYIKVGEELGIDLVNNPNMALTPYIAFKIMIIGMMDG